MAAGGADGRIVIDTDLNNKGFTRGLHKMKGELGGLTSVVKQLGATIAVAFGVGALVKFGKESIALGSSVAEVQNVVDVAFGDMAYSVEVFASTAIEQFGMSELAAKRTASTYMAMGKGMGITGEAAAKMAIDVAGLTGDMASFYNVSQDVADTALKSIWTGETESLKQFGVVMTQANLQQFAYSRGVQTNISDMAQAEQVMLRYKYVTNQLSLAQGDFAKTSDSWANQTRILSMQWQELQSIIGQTLIVVLKPLVKTLNEIVSSMIQVATTINGVITALFGGAQQGIQQTEENAENVGGAIGDSVKEQDDLTDAVEATGKAQKKALASFDELNKLSAGADEAGNATPAPVPGIPGGGKDEAGEQAVSGLSQKLLALFGSVKQWLSEISVSLQSIWDLVVAVGTSFAAVWTDGTGARVLDTIKAAITNIINIIGTLAERFRLAWDANKNGEAIWRAILNIIQSVVSFVDRIVEATLRWAGGLNLEPIVSAFHRLLEAIGPLVNILLDGLAWAYESVLLPLGTWVIEKAVPAVIDLLAAAIKALTPIIEALQPLALWLWENFLKPLGQWTGEIIISAIEWLTEKLTAFSAWAADNKDVIADTAVAVATLFTIFAAYKIAEAIPGIVAAFTAFGGSLALANPKIILAALAVGALVFAVLQIARAWENMSGFERAISLLSALAIAALGTAIALGAFQSAATMGLAAAGIVAGILAITAAVNSAQARAGSMGGKLSSSSGAGRMGNLPSEPMLTPRSASYSVPRLALGAVIPPNNEFLAVLGDQKRGYNYEVPDAKLRQLIREEAGAVAGARQTVPQGDIVLQVDGQSFARIINPYFAKESHRVGTKLVT